MYADRITLNPQGRIDSWKAIAAFLNSDERTVQRWEKDRALPVHRPAGERGIVFAYRNELLAWSHSAACPSFQRASQREGTDRPPAASKAPVAVNLCATIRVAPHPTSTSTGLNRLRERWWFWLSAAGLAFFLFLADTFHDRIHASEADLGVPSTSSQSRSSQSGARAAAPQVPPQDAAQAREFYLRGNYYRSRRTAESLQHAVQDFTQAIVHNPAGAQAYAGLAATFELMPEYSGMPASEAFPRALTAARRAVALDPNSAEAHRTLAFGLLYWEWQVPAAMAEFQRALRLDPTNAETHHWYATALFTVRRSAEAQREIALARELNPASRAILADQALLDFTAGADRADCLRRLRELERSEPDFAAPPRYLAGILRQSNDLHGWAVELRHMANALPSPQTRTLAHAAERGWSRNRETGLLNGVRTAQQHLFDQGQTTGYDLALICLRQGDRVAAMHYLQAAFDAHDFRLLSLVHEPEAQALRDFAPFQALQAAIQQRIDSPQQTG